MTTPGIECALRGPTLAGLVMLLDNLKLDAGSCLLHVGAGCGSFCHAACLRTGAKAVGLESSRSLVKEARESATALGLHADRCKFEPGSLRLLSVSWLERRGVTHIVCFDECLDKIGWRIYSMVVRAYWCCPRYLCQVFRYSLDFHCNCFAGCPLI